MYLFNSHSKDEHDNLLSSGTAVLLNFESLYSPEKYIRLVYYNAYPQTLYFQVQFIKVHCTVNGKKRHNDKKESIKKHKKKNMWNVSHEIFYIRKQSIRQILK